MPARRVPWIKLRVDLPDHEKLASLPDDSARWGWVCVLTAAKTQRRLGVFAGRAHLAAVVSQSAPFIEHYVDVGLLHVAPIACPECAPRHAADDLKAGELVIHDYLVEQRDPTNADRQDTFRRLQAAMQALEAAGISLPLTDRVQAHVTLSAVTTPPADPATPEPDVTLDTVTHEPIPIERGRRNGNVTPDSRARGTTVTTTVRETTTTEKNVSDGEVDLGNEAREADPDPILSQPNRAACTDYVRHQTRHRLVDGVAVCDACEEKLGEDGSGGAAPSDQKALGL